MARYGAAGVGSVLEHHSTPKVGHLVEMRLPIPCDFGCEDWSQASIRSHTSIEITNQRGDERTVDQRMRQRHFGLRSVAVGNGWHQGSLWRLPVAMYARGPDATRSRLSHR